MTAVVVDAYMSLASIPNFAIWAARVVKVDERRIEDVFLRAAADVLAAAADRMPDIATNVKLTSVRR